MKKIYLIAFAASILAGILFFNYLENLEQNSQIEYEEVLVAAIDIPAYQNITEEMVMLQKVPAGYSHPKSAKNAAQALGKISESKILAGEQILPDKLKVPGESEGGLSFAVPSQMRAITISVDTVSGVAGFIRQGDRVDVIAVMMTPDPEDSESQQNTSLVVCQNSQVIAVGSNLVESTESAAYSSITLLVSPEDAMRIALSSSEGKLRAILRAPSDISRNNEPPKDSEDMLELPK